MDPSLIQSLTGTASTAESQSKRAEAGDGDAFSKALEDATGKTSNTGKASSSMIDEKSDKTTEKKEEKKKQAKAEHEEFTKAVGQPADKGTPAYLRKLMHTNPDVMTMAEKQAARVGEFSLEAQVKQQQKPTAQPGVANFSGAAAKLSSGLPPQGVFTKEAASEGNSEKSLNRQASADDKADFEKKLAISKDVAGEKGPVNLEKLLSQEAKTVETAQKSNQAEKMQERQGVINQILSQIEVRNLAARSELHLRLNPEYLGELKLNLVHTDEGVRADFTTTSRATRALLQEGEEELRTSAQGKGVRMGAMTFKLVDDLN